MVCCMWLVLGGLCVDGALLVRCVAGARQWVRLVCSLERVGLPLCYEWGCGLADSGGEDLLCDYSGL